ncbi:MAG: alpha-N-acetylglucosaminidase [Rheinheimera sp.]|nr:alpha-N-acetylglucosaminidase [Rheinheimera sp.]
MRCNHSTTRNLALLPVLLLAALWQQVAHADPAQEAKAVLQRVTGQTLPRLELAIEPAPSEAFQVQARDGKLQVRAGSAVAATYGAYQYLRQQGQLHVSWEGNRVNIPARFEQSAEQQGLSGTALFSLRAYMNVCTFGYSTPFWDWSRWQQEIDWMALHGINQPLAMEGQEYIWQQLWREFGLTEAELAGFFSAPTVAPWQRMGNIENHLGPLPQSWINKKKDLQQQILTRMQALGMKPVLPAFSGYVPKAFKQRFPQAKINRMEPWSGFDRESYWLDPADPLFATVAKRFLELYQATYPVKTAGQYYLADAFNEMLPPLSGDATDAANRDRQLADYGLALYQSIAQVQPDATWVLQGWMFGDHAKFWQPAAVKAFLSKVPKAKTLVHDIGNDRFDVWRSTSAYAGAQWVYGFIHNYGGSNPLYGDLGFYQQQVRQLTTDPARGALTGYGAFPEGIENNSLVYDFIYDQAWQVGDKPAAVQPWIKQYLQARYGKVTPELLHSWQLLEQALYQTRYWGSRWWEGSAGAYLLFKRPQRNFTEFGAHAGDQVKLRRALNSLLLQAPQYADSPLFQHDVLEFSRHYLSIELDLLLQQSVRAYQHQQYTKADGWLNEFSAVVRQLDSLLGAQPQSLSQWLQSAVAYGDTPAESRQYLHNAKMLLTVWGGTQLKDYASRGWQGMYAGFYLPRWLLFFDTLKQQPQISDAELDRRLRDFELQWSQSAELFPATEPTAPLTQLPALLQSVDQLNKAAGVALLPKKALASHQGARP